MQPHEAPSFVTAKDFYEVLKSSQLWAYCQMPDPKNPVLRIPDPKAIELVANLAGRISMRSLGFYGSKSEATRFIGPKPEEKLIDDSSAREALEDYLYAKLGMLNPRDINPEDPNRFELINTTRTEEYIDQQKEHVLGPINNFSFKFADACHNNIHQIGGDMMTGRLAEMYDLAGEPSHRLDNLRRIAFTIQMMDKDRDRESFVGPQTVSGGSGALFGGANSAQFGDAPTARATWRRHLGGDTVATDPAQQVKSL